MIDHALRSIPTAAIILAAGASARYGGNKLLQPFGEGTVLGAVLAAARGARLWPRVLVTGHDHEAIEAATALDSDLVRVHNPRHAEGEMSSSIGAGLAWLSRHAPEADGALIILGDLPLLTPALLQAVVAEAARGGPNIVAPRYKGQRGHPVWLARAVWDDAMALKPGAQLRELLRARPDEVLLFDVDDPAILMDVDTPEQMQEARDTQVQRAPPRAG